MNQGVSSIADKMKIATTRTIVTHMPKATSLPVLKERVRGHLPLILEFHCWILPTQ